MADPVKPSAPQGPVPVFVPGLGVRLVDATDAPAALADGARVASATEHEEARLEERYSGVEGHIAPFAAGAARGLTLGGSDVLLSEVGGDKVRRRLADYQHYSPVASAAGEIGAIAGAALLGNEAGWASLPNAIGRLGGRVGASVARGLGGGLIAKGAGALATGAVEGAIYSEGKAASDAAIHNEALTAEKMAAAAGHGALFGAGANALFAGAGSALGRAVEGAQGLRAPRLGAAVEAEAGSFRGRVGDALEKTADVKTIKALGGSAGDLRALENNVAGGFRKVAQDIRSDVEAATGKSIGLHSRESLHEYATARVEELGERLGGMLRKLDSANTGIAPDVAAFTRKVNEQIVAPNVVVDALGQRVIKPGQGEVVRAAESWLDEVAGAYGSGKAPTFTEWQQARRALDKQINFARRNATPEEAALKQIRGIMEGELEASGELAAKNVGGSFAEEYKAAKSLYQSVRQAEELTERGVSRQLVNNSFGLGATIGAATGMATGGPVGGLAMGLAGKLVKDRGDMLAADLLSRAANIVGVQRLAARASATVSEGVASLLGTKALTTGAATSSSRSVSAPLGVTLSGNLHKDFDNVSAEAVKLSTNPVQLTDRIAKSLGPEAAKAPGLAAAITHTLLGDVAYLSAKLPPPRTDALTLQPQLQPATRASDAEKSEYLRAARALDNPAVMLKDAKDGSLTPTTVEAIKERRPELYEAMRQEIFQSLVTSKSELPYGHRIQLGILLDLPTDQTLAPDFVSAIQATYTASEKAGVEPTPPQLSQLDVAGSSMTATQAASGGLDR